MSSQTTFAAKMFTDILHFRIGSPIIQAAGSMSNVIPAGRPFKLPMRTQQAHERPQLLSGRRIDCWRNVMQAASRFWHKDAQHSFCAEAAMPVFFSNVYGSGHRDDSMTLSAATAVRQPAHAHRHHTITVVPCSNA